MLTKMNRLIRNKGLTTIEFAGALSIMGAFVVIVSASFMPRQFARIAQKGAVFMADNSGLPGGYDAGGYADQAAGADMEMTQNSHENLIVSNTDLTFESGGGTNGTGTRTVTGTQ